MSRDDITTKTTEITLHLIFLNDNRDNKNNECEKERNPSFSFFPLFLLSLLS